MEVVVFVGLQASGKTSFFRERFAGTHVHVSKDNFPNHRRPSKRQAREIRAALNAGKSLVVDNTNPTPPERRQVIELAREYGARVVCYSFESDPRACFERNAAREEGKRVPEVGFYATVKKFEPPSPDEGFDEIHHVRFCETGWEVRQGEVDESN
jgi:predicted kinase